MSHLLSDDRDRRGNPPVAPPRQRLDVARRPGIVAEHRAEAFHRGVEAVLEIHERAVGPEPVADLVARHHGAPAREQQPEDLERLLLQPDAGAAFHQLARRFIERDLQLRLTVTCPS